jgi:hypothetical protein
MPCFQELLSVMCQSKRQLTGRLWHFTGRSRVRARSLPVKCQNTGRAFRGRPRWGSAITKNTEKCAKQSPAYVPVCISRLTAIFALGLLVICQFVITKSVILPVKCHVTRSKLTRRRRTVKQAPPNAREFPGHTGSRLAWRGEPVESSTEEIHHHIKNNQHHQASHALHNDTRDVARNETARCVLKVSGSRMAGFVIDPDR